MKKLIILGAIILGVVFNVSTIERNIEIILIKAEIRAILATSKDLESQNRAFNNIPEERFKSLRNDLRIQQNKLRELKKVY